MSRLENEVLCEKLEDLMTPGFVVEFDPEEADRLGSFTEDAVGELDATESSRDE